MLQVCLELCVYTQIQQPKRQIGQSDWVAIIENLKRACVMQDEHPKSPGQMRKKLYNAGSCLD
jgi:hypothetical protein